MNTESKELLTALSQALNGTEQQKREAQAVLTKYQLREGGEVGEPPYDLDWPKPITAENPPKFPCLLWLPSKTAAFGGFWSPTLLRETWENGMPSATHWMPDLRLDSPLPPPNVGQA